MSRAIHPVRLHLDTSDYANMYLAAPGTPQARVRDELKEMAQGGHIVIGLSYHVVFELLQKAEPKYREDRLARARLLTELCGQNAFPYPTDLGEGPYFSETGLWVPRIDLEEIEIERIVKHMIDTTLHHPRLRRNERRFLSKRGNFAKWACGYLPRLSLLPEEIWPLPFAREFAESGYLGRYLLGEMSRNDANKKLRFYITDPVTVYKVWFELYGRDNPVAERRDQLANKFVQMFDGLRAMLNRQAAIYADTKTALAAKGADGLNSVDREKLARLQGELKAFSFEITSPQELDKQNPIWGKLFGDRAALVAAQIFYAFYREKREFRPSDAIDFIHAMYLPHTDLWRGDRAFSDLLVRHKVDFNERVVPTLLELPGRIETEIARRECS